MAGVTIAGCQSEPTEETVPSARIYAFQGTADPKFVGEWHTEPDLSTLDMHKDGTLNIVAVVAAPSGHISSKIKGEWLVSGSDLLLRYAPPKGGPTVVLKYSADLSGDTMKVVQAGNGVKSTYRRKPKSERERAH